MTRLRSHRGIMLVGALLLATLFFNPAMGESRFRQLTMAAGLSNARVFCLLQDHRGYIWLATEDGLDRYDGYTIKAFKNNPADPASISSNLVRVVFEDGQHRLWIGTTGGGLDLYNPDNNTFKHYRHISGKPDSIGSNNIRSLGSTSNGKLLIGTYDSGLDVFDPQSGTARHFSASPTGDGPSDNEINNILHDPDGIDWLATQSGLDAYNENTGHFTHYHQKSRTSEMVRGITRDKEGRLWIASNNGLQYLQPGDAVLHDLSQPRSLPVTGNLSSVFSDSHDNLWIGSVDSGLYLKSHDSPQYEHFHQNTGDLTSLSSDALWDIYQDNSGLIWVTTDNGVDILDPGMQDTVFIRPLLVNGAGPRVSNHIGAVFSDGDSLWLTSTAGIYDIQFGLTRELDSNSVGFLSPIDPTQYRIITSFLRLNKDTVLAATATGWLLGLDNAGKIQNRWKIGNDVGLKNLLIFGLIRNTRNTVLVATYGNGLLEYDMRSKVTRQIAGNTSSSLPRNAKLLEFLKALHSQLFVATTNGLFHIDLDDYRSEPVLLNPGGAEPEPISLYADKRQHLWVGTIRGLWRLTLDSMGAVLARKYFSIDNNSISGIEPDGSGNLWLAGDNAIIRFNPVNGQTLDIGNPQNLPISGFYANAHAHTANGWLWFGGPDGLIGLAPRNVKANPIAPHVSISDVAINRDDHSLSFNTNANEPLKLKYNDSLITFNLAVLDYGFPDANTFSYRLMGTQANWTPPSTAHQIIFPSLEPGHYRLEVRGANNWDVWSKQPAILDVVVMPPWWKTWWAYLAYTLLVLGGMFAYVHTQQLKLRKEREISAKLRDADSIKSNFVSELETRVSNATGELRSTLETVNLKNQELEIAHKRASEGEQLKSQFLANMSHELRTPLNAILGYLRLLLQTNATTEQTEYLNTIQHSSESLLAIINDTLDLSRIESGKLLIDEIDFDLLELIENTIELLGPSAYSKRIAIIRIVPPEIPVRLRGDPLRIRQILTNLVGNAIKFTQSGSVCIRVQEIERHDKDVVLGIAVSDTGIGIPAAGIAKLFDAYIRHESATLAGTEGTGLGLSICKKLLDLMGGEIEVLSTPGVGSTFEFRLPFKTRKLPMPSARFPAHVKIALLDNHPLSHQAWRASLTRLGLDVVSVRSISALKERGANAIIIALGPDDVDRIHETALGMGSIQLPHIVLAPTAERRTLDRISEVCKCRAQNTLIRESALFSEIRMLIPATPAPNVVMHNNPVHHHYNRESDSTIPVILVADDNAINRKLLVTLLQQNKFRVLEAANGQEFLALAAREVWDLALVDIHMPDMDGMEAARQLIAMKPDFEPIVIAISADALPETRAHALAAGMKDYLVKPYSEEQLLEVLRRHLPTSRLDSPGED
jgi:signal transduction histidine kinase/CheY-like chemotaxis protein